ncbi:unnamed protein product [Gongylonema pulchrum]|uniref:PC4 domain-containing protein n=1 Tax=Gongylonema pulchrum TaxID=637853 RepID=A0A183DTE4_9BILA|nr:unnamed protein product [Gongylonema pulchrum]
MSDSNSSAEAVKEEKPKKKATKKRAKVDDSSSDEGVIDATPMLELGKMRYVTVRSFRGKPLIDIREYYLDKVRF